jgi:hypothetical protein
MHSLPSELIVRAERLFLFLASSSNHLLSLYCSLACSTLAYPVGRANLCVSKWKNTYSIKLKLKIVRKFGSYNSLGVAPEGNPSGGYTGGSSGRTEVLACGLFSYLNSDLLEETVPRPPGSQGSIRLVATARGFSQDTTAEV